MIISGLIYFQYRGILDKKDLLIIGTITVFLLLLTSFVGILELDVSILLIQGLMSAAGLTAVTSVFKLIYQGLSKIL